MEPQQPTVFVVDDDEAARMGVEALAASVSFKVEAFASAQEFLDACSPDAFGCLLLDVRMPNMSGLRLQDELNRKQFNLPIIFITGHGDVAMAVDAFRRGAFDFIEKPIRGQVLLEKIQDAIEKHKRLVLHKARMEQIQRRKSLLTERELEILDCVQQGRGAKSIAQQFRLSRKTVDAHMAAIREKMGVDSTSQLILLLCQSGLLHPSSA